MIPFGSPEQLAAALLGFDRFQIRLLPLIDLGPISGDKLVAPALRTLERFLPLVAYGVGDDIFSPRIFS